jgi:Ca2+-binding RTX toxin-like protein
VKVDLEDCEADDDGRGGEDELAGIENVKGSAYHDYIRGDDCANIIDGGAGNDELYGEDGEDLLLGGAGNDKLRGGDDDDVLDGGAGNDDLDGECGDDLLTGGAGNDSIEGGSGHDLLYFAGATTGVAVSLTSGGKGTASDGLGGSDVLRGGINGAIGTQFADVLTGTGGTYEFHADASSTPAPGPHSPWWWNWWQH